MPHTHEGRGFTIATRQHVARAASPVAVAAKQQQQVARALHEGTDQEALVERQLVNSITNVALNALGDLNGFNSPNTPQTTSVDKAPQTTTANVAPTTAAKPVQTTPAYTPPATTPAVQTTQQNTPVQQTTADVNPTTQQAANGGADSAGSNGGGGSGSSGSSAGSGSSSGSSGLGLAGGMVSSQSASAASASVSSAGKFSTTTVTPSGASMKSTQPTSTASVGGGSAGSSQDRSSMSNGGVIGGAVGGVLGFLLLLGLAIWFFKRRRGKNDEEPSETLVTPGAAYEEYPPSPTFEGFPVTFDTSSQQAPLPPVPMPPVSPSRRPLPPQISPVLRGNAPPPAAPVDGYTAVDFAGVGTSRGQAESYPVQASLMFPANFVAPQPPFRATHAISYSNASTAPSTSSDILNAANFPGPSFDSPSSFEVGTPTTIRGGFVAPNLGASASSGHSARSHPPLNSQGSKSNTGSPARGGLPNFGDQLLMAVQKNRSNEGLDQSGRTSPTSTIVSQATVRGPPTVVPLLKPEGLPEPTLNTAWTSTRVGSIFPSIAPPKQIILRHSQHQGGQSQTPSPIIESPVLPWASPVLGYGNSPNPSQISLDSFQTAISGRTPAESVVENTGRVSLDSTYSDDSVRDLYAAYDASEDPFEDSDTTRESVQSLQSMESNGTLKGPMTKDLNAIRGSLAPSSQVDLRASTSTVLGYL
ncbi:hypothetical protein RQP46_001828 [Phenoliferia psychrophenolica]